MDRLLGHVRRLSRPLLISLRNTVRRRARLALTLTTLVLAGAIFCGVISTQKSMTASLTQMYSYYTADVKVDFEAPQRTAQVKDILDDAPGVDRVEGWIFASGEVMPGTGRIARTVDRVATDQLTIAAPPADSVIVTRDVIEGRFLLPEDRNAILMCTRAMRGHPDWKIGSTVRLRLNGQVEADFVIVGTFPFASGEGNKMAIASQEYLAELYNQPGRAQYFRIMTSPRDRVTEDLVRDESAARLKAAGYRVSVLSGHSDAEALNQSMGMIIAALLGLALLIGLVGGLGLAGMMSMNVLERTREIGVMRSIGATNGDIMQLVLVEGLLTGLLSWVGGVLLGIPMGKFLSFILGQGIFDAPFSFIMDWRGPLIWLVVVVVLSIVASLLPAWNASRLTIREVLAYE